MITPSDYFNKIRVDCPQAGGDLGSYVQVVRADGQLFDYNTTLGGSELRRVGEFAPSGAPNAIGGFIM